MAQSGAVCTRASIFHLLFLSIVPPFECSSREEFREGHIFHSRERLRI